MKAIILAGGVGSRISREVNKPKSYCYNFNNLPSCAHIVCRKFYSYTISHYPENTVDFTFFVTMTHNFNEITKSKGILM